MASLALSTVNVALVLHYRKTSRHALNVLAGAVASAPATASMSIGVANSPSDLVTLLGAARSAGRRTVVAWSFYSASFAEASAELAAVRITTGGDVLHVAG